MEPEGLPQAPVHSLSKRIKLWNIIIIIYNNFIIIIINYQIFFV